MENFVKHFVIAVIITVAEKLGLTKEEVIDYFHAVLWDEYKANGKANEILRKSIPELIKKSDRQEAMALLGIKNYALQIGNRVFVASDEDDFFSPNILEIEPGTRVFNGLLSHFWPSIDEVILPNSLEMIENSAFAWLNISHLEIPARITTIPSSLCVGCRKLTKVQLPGHLVKIEGSAFRFCKSLEGINIPESVVEIGELAFEGCESLPEETKQRILAIGGPAAFGASSQDGI